MASEGDVKGADPREHIFGFGRRCVFLTAVLDFIRPEHCHFQYLLVPSICPGAVLMQDICRIAFLNA